MTLLAVLLLVDLTSLLPAASKLLRFEQYTSTRLLAQFDEDLPQIQKISMRISTGNVIGPRYKIRLLRVRLTPLDRPERWGQTTPEADQDLMNQQGSLSFTFLSSGL